MALKSNKDKAMSADLKKRGVTRTTGKCCVCYATINNADTANHYARHAWGSDKK